MLNITQTTHDKLSENYVKDGEKEIILLEEVNKYLNFINSISYKAEILSC